jgi:hypothetical protein
MQMKHKQSTSDNNNLSVLPDTKFKVYFATLPVIRFAG